jgi:hypothetical protein
MPSDMSLKGYTYFGIGWPTWGPGRYFLDIPKEKAHAEKNEKTGEITGYYIDDVHLIIDKYYGEFYNENLIIPEIAKEANKYAFGCVFARIGKFARYSSVELHSANCTSGMFITMGSKTFTDEIRSNDSIGIPYLNFTQGRLNDNGELNPNDNQWFTTNKFFEIGKRFDGTDIYNSIFKFCQRISFRFCRLCRF